jgi:pyridoxine 5-phosphate synthase
MSVILHVNVDHIATLRQARGTTYPDPVEAAFLCERAGAEGITVHLREDKRHIQPRDVRVLKETVRGVLNLEMGATEEMLAFALEVRPNHVTFVPERREERTTEGGLDVAGQRNVLASMVKQLQAVGVYVSMFVAPARAQLEASKAVGAQQVELHTGDYANAHGAQRVSELKHLAEGARVAQSLGLRVAAGHGLTVENVGDIAAIYEVIELNIGHAIVADASIVGMASAVRAMRRAIARGARRKTR